MGKTGNVVPAITAAEHIGPDDTGDNIEAKRVANYGFRTDSLWARQPLPLIDAAWDNFVASNPDLNGNNQTIVFKNGATTVRTLTLVFDSNSNVTNLSRA